MGAGQSAEQHENSICGTTDLRFLASTKVSTSGDINFVPSKDNSSCYYWDFEFSRFVHVNFETETEIVLDFQGFKEIKEPTGWNNFVAVPIQSHDDDESRFLASVIEKITGKCFLVMFSANKLQNKVSICDECSAGFQRQEDYYYHLLKSSEGEIYAVALYWVNEDTTIFSVTKIMVDESPKISRKVIFQRRTINGLWDMPFIDEGALYFLTRTNPINEIFKIPLNGGSDPSTISILCGCASCEYKHGHSFGNGKFSSAAHFGEKVVFAITVDNYNSSLWSINCINLRNLISSDACIMQCEEQFTHGEVASIIYPVVHVSSDGSSFLYTQSTIFQLNLSISDDYDIGVELLGKGTHGDVMKGNISGRTDVAIKIIKNDSCTRKLLLSAIAEAKKLKTIDHKNIVKGFGYKIEQRRFLLFMELMKESVRHYIFRTDDLKLNENEAFGLLQQALEGLVHLHTLKPKPIIHRNIKCSNMLLSDSGIVKLGDFGLVQTISLNSCGSTDLNQVIVEFAGTAYWQAPELPSDSVSYGRKADVWSLGCSLVEMLTGFPPYHDMKLTEWIRKANEGVLSYDPKELIPNTAVNAISLLQKIFRRETNGNHSQVESKPQSNRPHSWEILADVMELNMTKLDEQRESLEQQLETAQLHATAMRNLSTKEREHNDDD